jgi:hypothetical protein
MSPATLDSVALAGSPVSTVLVSGPAFCRAVDRPVLPGLDGADAASERAVREGIRAVSAGGKAARRNENTRPLQPQL